MKETDMVQFAEAVKKGIQERLGEGYTTSFTEVEKNNGVKLPAICIHREGSNTSAAVYIEEYLALYKEGMGLGDIADRIVKRFRETADMDIETGQICDYEKVKGMLMVKVVNTEKNRSFLKQAPHEEFLNLSAVPVIRLLDAKGYGTITVKRSLAGFWGVTEEELLAQAKANTQKIEPYELYSMEEFVEEFHLQEEVTGETNLPMLILTNKAAHLGAAAVLCADALEEAWEKFGKKDFYVLPSSVHEVIFMPADCGMTAGEIRDIVQSVNRTEVDEKEFLSDDIYVYRGECGKLEMVK